MNNKLLVIILVCIGAGIATGLGSFTFIYGKGYSYLADDPKACVNCHIMRDQYESWLRSSHHNVTTCNSCHTPENPLYKMINKAENGFSHSWKFTLAKFKDPIVIREHNFDITMKACLKCHGNLMSPNHNPKMLQDGRSCVQCHRNVGHTH